MTPHGEVFIQNKGASEDAVRLGLKRLASTDRQNNLDCSIQQFSVEETEKSMDESGRRTNDVKMSQKWPSFGSVIRDIASKRRVEI